MFSSRHEWKHHEYQMHRREYMCDRCCFRSTDRREMSMHLQECCGGNISPDEMNTLLDICNHPLDPSDGKAESCTLCGDVVPPAVWHDHVGAHMEYLSLLILPAPENDEEEEIEVFSPVVTRVHLCLLVISLGYVGMLVCWTAMSAWLLSIQPRADNIESTYH
ncbi:hypothetical protein F5Y10DRAFT_238189 [Nemania abortiva]|nr:hypothetical protein F5Y10DRAFT_238189 [Nemania abortiva]